MILVKQSSNCDDMDGLKNSHLLMGSPKKRKLQLFPPIEVSNKSNILSRGLHASTINTFDVPQLESEPQTPPSMNLLTADQILAPVRSRRRPIGSPKPRPHTNLNPPDFNIPTLNLSKSLPSIMVDSDDDAPSLPFHRPPTPLPTTGRQRLMPLGKLKSGEPIKETDWRVANKEINVNASADSNDFRYNNLFRSKRRTSRVPIQLPNSKPILEDIKTTHPFAPD